MYSFIKINRARHTSTHVVQTLTCDTGPTPAVSFTDENIHCKRSSQYKLVYLKQYLRL